MVPIQVDALHSTASLAVTGAMADFRRLPYYDGTQDVNADVAYISEDLVTPPFHDQPMALPAGLHLHWSLPAAFTRSHTVGSDAADTRSNSKPTNDGQAKTVTFPAVPNVWLIRRQVDEKDPRHWIVESDYLYPEVLEGDRRSVGGATSDSICYPDIQRSLFQTG